MYKIILILALLFNSGCAFMVAKETVKIVDKIDIALEGTPNPDKKKKILEKQKTLKEKSREFYCSKVKDKEKCNNVQ
tara:strand:- start:618 stop:848 length:231 start_codon:yes stop_codon:yes gene_type:complete